MSGGKGVGAEGGAAAREMTEAIDARLAAAVSGHVAVPLMEEALRYALFPGGKRLRPRLVTALASDLGRDADAALGGAVALECLHVASLVHDDLPSLDDDDERRGRPALHVRFDEATAVLAGDYLTALAFAVSAPCRDQTAALARAYCSVCEGQLLDVAVPRSDPDDVRRRKTGSLFSAAFEIGTGIYGAGGTAHAAGEAFGLLFQVRDDVTDGDLGARGGIGAAAESFERAWRALGDEVGRPLSATDSLINTVLETPV